MIFLNVCISANQREGLSRYRCNIRNSNIKQIKMNHSTLRVKMNCVELLTNLHCKVESKNEKLMAQATDKYEEFFSSVKVN